jgi:hypothetical protein
VAVALPALTVSLDRSRCLAITRESAAGLTVRVSFFDLPCLILAVRDVVAALPFLIRPRRVTLHVFPTLAGHLALTEIVLPLTAAAPCTPCPWIRLLSCESVRPEAPLPPRPRYRRCPLRRRRCYRER